MSIPNHIFDQLNNQADLVSIIGKHTTLKKAGNEYKGCCPFHGEKTPSFYVNPQKNLYHCFGCGVRGNAISFLKDYENLTFMEAVKELSKQTGIEIPEEENQKIKYKKNITPTTKSNHINTNISDNYFSDSQIQTEHSTPEFLEKKYLEQNFEYDFGMLIENDLDPNYQVTDLESWNANQLNQLGYSNTAKDSTQEGDLYELLNQIHNFYSNCLQQNLAAQDYFQSRGLSKEIINIFGLGYAPSGWQHLEAQFPNDIEGLKLLGLIRQSEKGKDYNLLRDRVIFTIRDNQGRIIGFAGRALNDEVKPKYINSSDSPVFHKQNILYGYYESRQKRVNDWLVVEGYMDVIALYQAGIYGAVASMGTSINESQISRLLTLNSTLTLSFDGDSAGQKAAWRALEVSLPVLTDEKELRFLLLPDKHDPDTYIKEHGVTLMKEQIANATPLSVYVFDSLSQRYNLTQPEGKAKLMSQVRTLTNQLPKGSSFRSLLNNDIYQKLSGRKSYDYGNRQTLLDFTTQLTSTINLCLCLLYQPKILENNPIDQLWESSGVLKLKTPEKIIKKITELGLVIPQLPNWNNFDDSQIIELVTCIKSLIPYLPKDANTASHFILASLPNQLQKKLAFHWKAFYTSLLRDGTIDIEPLFYELLIQELLASLQRQHRNIKNIYIRDIINKRRTKLIAWQKSQNKT